MIEGIPILATFAIGLFTGSLLTEGMILVPYWRRMPPADFFRLHSSLGPSLFRYFAPLTVTAVALGVLTVLVDQARTPAWLLTGILCFSTLAIFFIYFRKANNGFAEHSIAEDALGAELQRWAMWHWIRTGLMLVAFAYSIWGHLDAT